MQSKSIIDRLRAEPTFIRDTAERAVLTFVQAFAAALVALDTGSLETAVMAGLAAVASLLKSIIARSVGDPESASLDPRPGRW